MGGLLWFDDLVIVALKEAEYAYDITGIAQGIRNDLKVENWRPDRSYLETVGVNCTAKRLLEYDHGEEPKARP